MSANVPVKVTQEGVDKAKGEWAQFHRTLDSFINNVERGFRYVTKAFQTMDESMERHAKAQALKVAFGELSGSSEEAALRLDAMRESTMGLVADTQLYESANKAMQLGVANSAKDLATLSQSAVTLGRAMGLDASQAVDNLITAIGRQSNLLLDNLGFTVDVAKANEAYAKSLGIARAELTDTQRAEAFRAAALDAAADRVENLGGLVLSAADKWQTLKVEFANSRDELDTFVAEVAEPVIDWLRALVSQEEGVPSFIDYLRGAKLMLMDVGEIVGQVFSDIVKWIDGTVRAIGTVTEALGFDNHVVEMWEGMKGSMHQVTEGMKEYALASRAMQGEQNAEAVYIKRVRDALGVNIKSYEHAKDVVKRFALNLDEMTEARKDEIEMAERAEAAEKDAADAMEKAMKLLGIKTEETREGLKRFRAEGDAAFKLIQDSGTVSAQVLEEHYGSFLKKTGREFDQFGTVVEQELVSSTDAAVDAFIAEQKAKLSAGKGDLAQGVSDGLTAGFVEGTSQIDYSPIERGLTEATGRSMQQIQSQLADIYSTSQSIASGDVQGMTGQLDERGLEAFNELRAAAIDIGDWFTGSGTEFFDAALNAISSGSSAQVKSLMDAIRANQATGRRTLGGSHEFQAAEGEKMRILQALMAIFDFQLNPLQFARGGVIEAKKDGTMAFLHGREAVLPLDDEGAMMAIKKAIFGSGEDQKEAASMLREAISTSNDEGNDHLRELVKLVRVQVEMGGGSEALEGGEAMMRRADRTGARAK